MIYGIVLTTFFCISPFQEMVSNYIFRIPVSDGYLHQDFPQKMTLLVDIYRIVKPIESTYRAFEHCKNVGISLSWWYTNNLIKIDITWGYTYEN